MDGNTVYIPGALAPYMAYIQECLDLEHDDEGDHEMIELFSVTSEDLQKVAHFLQAHIQNPVDVHKLQGPNTLTTNVQSANAAPAASAAGAAAEDEGGLQLVVDKTAPSSNSHSIPRVLPRSLNLEAWGLPKWTVDWLNEQSTPQLLTLLDTTTVVDCSCMQMSILAKLSALVRSIDQGVLMNALPSMSEDLSSIDGGNVPEQYKWALEESVEADTDMHSLDAPLIIHELRANDMNMPYTVEQFVKEVVNLPEGLFRAIVYMM